MAVILLQPITQEEADGRSVFSGGMGGLGFAGDDCWCGHCEAVIFTDFDPDVLVGDFVFQCAVCSEFNERPPGDERPQDETLPEDRPLEEMP